MCDKKNSVLFTDTGCFVLSHDFKLADESQVLLKVPRKNNMYSVDMKNIVPKESLTCLIAKAMLDESMIWHRRLGHVNFKTINKLVKDNLVKGLPIKHFENDKTCVACLKEKQHKAFCKSKIQNFITQPLFMLHMDLFGLTFDETSGILKSFITQIENLVDKKVKIIRCDNGTEFKNRVMSEFCEKKGIKREFSVARTPQQNGVAERRNRTLIEAARTMLADSKLPTTFWAEAVNTACYVQNRVLVVKPHNKTPYELFRGRTPSLSFMKPFGCHVTILNTLDHLGKFDGKSDDGFFVGYSLNSKAFRVYNIRTRKVEENLHVRFLEDKPIIAGDGPKWLFDIDVLTKSMNYVPVVAGKLRLFLRHLKLEDSDGISNLPTTKIFEQLALMRCRCQTWKGYHYCHWLEAGQGSDNIDKTSIMLYDSPLPRVHTLGSEVQGRHKHDMEPDFEFTTAEEVYTVEKGVSTAEPISTAGASVSTVGASSAKDKGKAIMEEAETIQTKTKLQLEQERLVMNRMTFKLELKPMKSLHRDNNLRKERFTLKLKKQDYLQRLSMRERDTLLHKELKKGEKIPPRKLNRGLTCLNISRT
ncbi:putative ribonuclease H-like domain-containing protein [Tanacetum coccineum]